MAKPNVTEQDSYLLGKDLHDFATDPLSRNEVIATHASTVLGYEETKEQHDALTQGVADSQVEGNNSLPFYHTADFATLNQVAYGDKENASPALREAASDAIESNLFSPLVLDTVRIKENRGPDATGVDAAGIVVGELLRGGTERAANAPELNSHYLPPADTLNLKLGNGSMLGITDKSVLLHELGHANAASNPEFRADIVAAASPAMATQAEKDILATLAHATNGPGDSPTIRNGVRNANEMYADTLTVAVALVAEGKEAALTQAGNLVVGRDAEHAVGVGQRFDSHDGPLIEEHNTIPAVVHFANLVETGAITPQSSPEEIKAAVNEAVGVGYTATLVESRYAEINPMTLTADGLKAGPPEGVTKAELVANDLEGKIAYDGKELAMDRQSMTLFLPENSGSVPVTVDFSDAGAMTAAGNLHTALVVPIDTEQFNTNGVESPHNGVKGDDLSFPGSVSKRDTPLGDFYAENLVGYREFHEELKARGNAELEAAGPASPLDGPAHDATGTSPGSSDNSSTQTNDGRTSSDNGAATSRGSASNGTGATRSGEHQEADSEKTDNSSSSDKSEERSQQEADSSANNSAKAERSQEREMEMAAD